jgi:hypothetical protein
MRSGKLVRNEREGVLQFAADVALTSPSAAAQAVMGTSRNGRIDWVVEGTNQPTQIGKKLKSERHKQSLKRK